MREQVERFQAWVYGEVLPSLRKQGRYEVAPREMTKLEALRAAIESEEGRIVAEARALEAEQRALALEPAAHSWEILASQPHMPTPMATRSARAGSSSTTRARMGDPSGWVRRGRTSVRTVKLEA